MNMLKKMLVTLLLLCLLCSTAVAEDFSAMTRDELLQHIATVKSELWLRDNNIEQSQALLTPVEGLIIYITDCKYDPKASRKQMTISFVIHNNSSENVDFYLDIASINDWQVDADCFIMIDAGYKARYSITQDASDLDMLELSSVSDIYAMRMRISANRNGNYSYGCEEGEGPWYYSLSYNADSDCFVVVDYDLRDYAERK